MDEEQRYRETVKEFYKIYRPLQKKHNLRMHSNFSIYNAGLIEIWEYRGEKQVKKICRIREENDIDCYRKAIEELKWYEKESGDKAYESQTG